MMDCRICSQRNCRNCSKAKKNKPLTALDKMAIEAIMQHKTYGELQQEETLKKIKRGELE